jgi:purine-binding chemotaxis protein CheW
LESMPVVVVRLDTQTYGLPIYSVGEICRMVAVTPLPEAHDLVEGVINVRGKTVPVINLSRRLEVREPPYELATRLVIVNFGERSMAVPVHGVEGVREIPEEAISLPTNLGSQTDLLSGVAELDAEQVLVLEPTALFTDDIMFKFPEWDDIFAEGEPVAPAPVPEAATGSDGPAAVEG